MCVIVNFLCVDHTSSYMTVLEHEKQTSNAHRISYIQTNNFWTSTTAQFGLTRSDRPRIDDITVVFK